MSVATSNSSTNHNGPHIQGRVRATTPILKPGVCKIHGAISFVSKQKKREKEEKARKKERSRSLIDEKIENTIQYGIELFTPKLHHFDQDLEQQTNEICWFHYKLGKH